MKAMEVKALEGGSVPFDVEATGVPKKLGLRICFKDLNYKVPSRDKKGEFALLLNSVSGFFEPNQMAALMGPSGSGKTTLLDVLAGRKTAGTTEGTIQFGGQKPTRYFLRRYTGYVEQFDTLLGTLTVYEMLLYTAELKRPLKEALQDKIQAVNDLMGKLALEACRNVLIGNALAKGISGGQAKRTNIGIALVTNPRVLFLDEPTSGLDSYTANEVMTIVKELINDGTTICATIHSPSAYCFSLFNRVILLVRGRVVYFGPNDSKAFDYFHNACPKIKPMESGYNEAEWLVDMVTDADRKGKGGQLADVYAQSDIKKTQDSFLDTYMQEKEELSEEVKKELAAKSDTVTPAWWGLCVLIKYRTSRNYRSAEFLGPRIGDKIIISLLIMTLYLGVGNELQQKNLVNIAAVLFMWCTLPAFGAASYVPAIVLERALFTRERSDGLYKTITYLVAKMFDELLLAGVASIGISAFVFYGVQLKGNFGLFWLVYFITLSLGIVLAYFIAALSPNMDVANAALPTYVVTLLFFGGFLFRFASMPPWWKWYSYIDFLRYSWGALMVNQFADDEALGRTVFVRTGDPKTDLTILENYGLAHVHKWGYVGYQSLFFIVFFTGAFLALNYIKHSNR